MVGLQKALRKLMTTQHENIILNKDGLEIILTKPNERIMLTSGKKIDDSLGLLNKLDTNENLDKFFDIVSTLLIECVRHPDDYSVRIIVKDDQEPIEYQTRFSDFDPKIDNEVLLAQNLITKYESDINALGSQSGKIAIFFLILRMMGILRAQKEAPPVVDVDAVEEENKKKQESLSPEEQEKRKNVVENYNEVESFPVNPEDTEKVDNSGTV